METIGNRVKALREFKRLSQTQFGEPLKLAFSSISAIEKGKSASTDTLRLIAEYYGVNAAWLINGEGQKPEGIIIPIRPGMDENPWKDALVLELKNEITTLKETNAVLIKLLERFTGTKAANFLNAPIKAGAGKVVSMLTSKPIARVGVNA